MTEPAIDSKRRFADNGYADLKFHEVDMLYRHSSRTKSAKHTDEALESHMNDTKMNIIEGRKRMHKNYKIDNEQDELYSKSKQKRMRRSKKRKRLLKVRAP